MPLLIVAFGVFVLLILMLRFKFNGFIALLLVAMLVGLLEGMPLVHVMAAIKKGMGDTLGNLAMILAFGAMLGKLMADSGAAQRIAMTLIRRFGTQKIQWAVVSTGFIAGFALFYEVGFVLMIPLVFTIAASANIPLLYIGIPMAAALSVTQGFLPPQPASTAIAGIYNADLGRTLIYGIILAIPTVIISGPLFARLLKKMDKPIHEAMRPTRTFTDEEMPGFGVSVCTALIPVFLMAINAITKMSVPVHSDILLYTGFIGDPVVATMTAVLVAMYTLGIRQQQDMKAVMATIGESVRVIAMIILIIGGGGAFKQVLVSSGVDKYIALVMGQMNVSPLVLAWVIAAALRIALGSATVAALTTSSIMAPLILTTGVNPSLMVIATGTGSLIFSHVNDPGFWLFKEYFHLSLPETFKSWSIMETVISVCGLTGTLVLSHLI